MRISWSPPVDKAQGGLTYKLRVVSPHVTITTSGVTDTQYTVEQLHVVRRIYTRYTVYVRAASFGVYGPEVSVIVSTAVGSESL